MSIHTGALKRDDLFSTNTAGLAEATPPTVLRVRDGETFALRIAPVANRVGDDVARMLAYNGSIPGPTLHVDQSSEIVVEVTNDGDADATVHSHGLRLANRYDGVPHETQAPPDRRDLLLPAPVPRRRVLLVPPHIREDSGLEMGLYGTIVVEPTDPSYWPPVDRQLTLTLDDLLIEDGHIAPFRRSGPTYTAMGRYGNVMLNQRPDPVRGADPGRRSRPRVPRQHGQHSHLLRRPAGRPHEAGRRTTAAATSARR